MKITQILLLVTTSCITSYAFEAREPQDTYASVQVEQFFTAQDSMDRMWGDRFFQNIWMYIGLPGFRVGSKNIFTAIECDLIHRDVYLDNEKVNKSVMQRYGFFSGITLIMGRKHHGSVMFGTGIATDFVDLGTDALFFHLIYDHQFSISEIFSFGVGILLSYNLGSFKEPIPINLLPSLRWQIHPRTFLKVAWDNLEIRQFITERVACVGEVRYDLNFFRLKGNSVYEFETIAAGGGVDVWIFKDFYLRIRYKELLFKNETIKRDGQNIQEAHTTVGSGRSVRLLLLYAK